MFTKLVCFVILVSPITAAVAKDNINSCSPTEFACGDGGCVSEELVCDGSRDCADGLDEESCGKSPFTLLSQETVLHRYRRQASGCRRDQWQCRDGSCISFDGKCDGVVDCTDGSDETHPLCRKNVCQQNWFRCTYGACVDGTAPCNGVKECADNSDELLPRCRNETDEVRGQFRCLDGSSIPASSHCDGTRDCSDGSDETVRTCAAKTCPSYLFQCAYGACVDSDADCNQRQDCADGSDESAELCDKSGAIQATSVKPPAGNCVLPARPEHGSYITNIPNGQPGDAYEFLVINVTCQQGYGVAGSRSVSCYNGWWPEPMSTCVSLCHLIPHPSVEYNCLVTEGGVTGMRPCKEYEPHGTVVSPRCQAPNYYSPTSLQFMRCIQGIWDYVAICTPGLTKNGTNITILIKDTVEIHVSDIQYVVPINNSNIIPLVPIRPTYDSLTTERSTTNKPSPTSNKPSDFNSGIDKFSEMVETISSAPYDNTIHTDTSNSNYNDNTESDESNSEIDLIDWRMGVPDNRGTRIPSILNDYTKKKSNNGHINQNHFADIVYHTIKPIENYEFSLESRFGDKNNKHNSGISNSTSKSSSRTSEKATTSIPENRTETKKYTSKSINTSIYFSIANSSVNVHADGDAVFKKN